MLTIFVEMVIPQNFIFQDSTQKVQKNSIYLEKKDRQTDRQTDR